MLHPISNEGTDKLQLCELIKRTWREAAEVSQDFHSAFEFSASEIMN